jgi:hypothetical protein
MKAGALLTVNIKVKASRDEDTSIRSKKRWQICLFAGAAAAAVTSTFGLMLSAASLIGAIQSNGRMSIAGTVLLAISFPMLIFTAHCLDKIDQIKTAIRVRSYQKYLLDRTEL